MARPLATVRPLANARYAVDAQRPYAAVNALGAYTSAPVERCDVSVHDNDDALPFLMNPAR